MCGINGVHHYRDGAGADGAAVERAALVQRHRGPDDAGVWAQGPVGLGQRRLAIVDLSPGGHQPLANEDETLWVTFNGEIYNWPTLRSGLAARGHRFRGSSDTEALLHLYEEHGDGMLAHLRGMFAFALWDSRRQRMLVARDRVGKKPLYWHDDGRRVAFASELKALLAMPGVPREVDPVAALDYLAFQYVPSPRSIWKGIHKLPPGHFLVSDANGVRVECYWSLPAGPVEPMPEAEAVERLRALLEESVRIRLMSDVPLGAFLSGGIDSSAVVAFMSKVSSGPVRTFSIGFDEQEFSELEHARVVARHLGTEHHEFVVRPRALELLPRLVWHLDEPFADASMVPAWSVAETARRHVTVALSGDGGDEAFGGYVTYPWALRYARFDHVPHPLRRLAAVPAPLLGHDRWMGRTLRRIGQHPAERHLDAMAFFPRHALAGVVGRAWRDVLADHDPWAAPLELHRRAARGLGDIPALLALDAMTYMTDDVLVKVDRTSMAHSLEVRCPLLDHEVLEFAARLPFHHKLRGGVSKWVLRESVRDLLPPSILARGKQGFGVPLTRWFGDDFGRLAREVLFDPRARARAGGSTRAASSGCSTAVGWISSRAPTGCGRSPASSCGRRPGWTARPPSSRRRARPCTHERSVAMNPRQWIRDSVRFAVTQYVVRAVLLLRGVIGARMLGPGGYGAWNALVLVMDYALSAPFGTQQGLDQTVPARIVQGDAERLERAKRAGLFNILVLTLLFSGVVLLYFLRGADGSMLGSWGIAGLVVGLACSGLTSLSNYHLSVLRSHGSMTAVSDWFVLQGVLGSLVGLALIPWFGAWGLLWGWLAGNLVALVQVRWKGRALVPMIPRFSSDSIELLRAGLPIFFFNSTHLVMRSLDRLIILRLLGTLELGYYSLSIMVLSLLMYLPDSLIYVVYPQLVSTYHAAGNDARAIRERVLRLLTVISVAVPALSGLAYLCAREAVLLLLPRFLEGVGAVRVLCFGGTGLALVGLGALALMSVGRQLRLVPAALAFVALGATLDVLALHNGYGIVGVAWATLLTYLAQGSTFLWLALGVLGLRLGERLGTIARAFAPFVIAIVLAVALDRYLPWHHVRTGPWQWLRLGLALVAFAGAYAAAVSPLLRGLGLRSIISELRPAGRSPHAESHVD